MLEASMSLSHRMAQVVYRRFPVSMSAQAVKENAAALTQKSATSVSTARRPKKAWP